MIEKIEELVVSMKSNTEIFSVLGDRIFVQEPLEEQNDFYLIINVIGQNQNISVNNRTALEFRYIGSNISTISSIDKIVTSHIVKSSIFFKKEIGNAVTGYTEDKRNVLIRDYVLYSITDF